MTGYWFIDQQKRRKFGQYSSIVEKHLLKMVDTSDYWKIDYEGACQNIHNFKINNLISELENKKDIFDENANNTIDDYKNYCEYNSKIFDAFYPVSGEK